MSATIAAAKRTATPSAPTGERHRDEGHGRRLLNAFDALESFPVLDESRNRLLSALAKEPCVTADVVAAIESEVGLAAGVLRLAAATSGDRGGVDTVAAAVELLGLDTIREVAQSASTFGFFERATDWGSVPERFRLHAVATQRIADRIAVEVRYDHRNRLAVTSLLHDIGKLVLHHAYPSYPSQVHLQGGTPEERLHQERRELGVDHALVGGVLARRWGLPSAVASAIERHHSPDARGEAALIRLADMLAYYEQSANISSTELLASAQAVGLGPVQLRGILYELPHAGSQRQRSGDPCPLSRRELEVLQRLAKGGIYKQIADDFGLSTSSIRSHLHNIYRKLNVPDRAQAVLLATSNGWI
ncbi:MAG: HDOD domain-containing protein [Solirubrobacteraceae bacterium]